MNAEQLSVFLEYTRRFDQLAQDLPINLREGALDQLLDERRNELSDRTQHALIRYFNFCGEEFYLHANKMIPDEIWNIWREQMVMWIRQPLFASCWAKIRGGFAPHAAYQKFVDEVVKS